MSRAARHAWRRSVVRFFDEEIAWAKERGIPFIEADGRLGKVYTAIMLGRLDEAGALLDQARAAFEEIGVATSIAEAVGLAAQIELLCGDLVAGESALREAIGRYDEIGAQRLKARTQVRLADLLCRQGRYDEASRLLDEVEQSGRADQPPLGAECRSAKAKMLAARGLFAEAVAVAREAVALVPTDDINLHAERLLDLATVLDAAGREAEAAAAVDEAIALYEEKGNVLGADQARELLARA
jgi:tetratricopeptide (TPR) repeat protein